MNTPIYDFAVRYRDLRPARFHMPGHKGRGPLGCEELDLTEIPGADSLYEASGIIAESERNASALFGCPTFYSTEGSSHCIRAMLFLAMQFSQRTAACPPSPVPCPLSPVACHLSPRFRVLAARNVHRTFLTAAALLDLDVVWLPQDGNYLTADPTPETVAAAIEAARPDALYLTCPDYLGHLPELRPIAELCHARGVLLLVDNAHGAYLRFLEPSLHPMDLGADLCCDSAHKTLPVLTGGAYLHVKASGIRHQASGDRGSEASGIRDQGSGIRDQGSGIRNQASGDGPREENAFLCAAVRDALALFGSTSPSYLILQSLDLANPFLERLPALLGELIPKIDALKGELIAAGYRLYGREPLKLTLDLRSSGRTGTDLASGLERAGIFCEFAGPDFLVCMFTPNTTDKDLSRLKTALLEAAVPTDGAQTLPDSNCQLSTVNCQLMSLRAAMLSPCVRIPAAESLGRILARPGVSCPPAVPILMPGERIDEAALAAFRYYGIETVDVLI